MNISIDYDDTYTKDPLLWDGFAQQAIDRGHNVYCVSARSQQYMNEPKQTIGKIIGPHNCFGTGLRPKRNHMYDVYGVIIHVWIDDIPEMITEPQIEGLYMP